MTAVPIEDYALIGDCETAALVGRDGSIDWLCLPRFDSDSCFAALLGSSENGRWKIAPLAAARVSRRYRDNTLILETTFETEEGVVRLVDFMPLKGTTSSVIRIAVGVSGRVQLKSELVMRFDYGLTVPWVSRISEDTNKAVAGPQTLFLRSPVRHLGKDLRTVGEFTLAAGDQVFFVLAHAPSHLPDPALPDAFAALDNTERFWREWCAKCKSAGRWSEAVLRSLITLKALTFAPTGGIVAAPTTSLPERLGGKRNWDYRYCWIRDATFTLYSLVHGGYTEEAHAWRDWLLRVVAGKPSELNIMYGLGGERRLTELELGWLPGYERSAPVRTGNAAHQQFQLDVYGEVMDALYVARREGLQPDENAWRVQRALIEFLESAWTKPDEGIWEVRGPRRHFTHSKVMAWVAVDRTIKATERFGLKGPVERWRKLCSAIHDEVCRKGFDTERNTFVQFYGGKELDASLLMIPLVGFLPPDDPRVRGTIAAIQSNLVRDGFVARYNPKEEVDGLPPGEGVFLPCTFWLADNLALQGRLSDAQQLFERLLNLCNDVGLLSEEYDSEKHRLVGNFPQAFTHVSLINTACNLSRATGPAKDRQES